MRIETERLLLRSLKSSDIPGLVQIWTDADVTHYMGGPRQQVQLLETFEAALHNPSPGPYKLWPVIEKVSSRLVGHCGLLAKEIEGEPEIELVYVFAKSAWGQGYATEIARALKAHAAAELGLSRLVALINPENQASERVALKAGFSFEKEVVRPGNKVMKLYTINMNLPDE